MFVCKVLALITALGYLAVTDAITINLDIRKNKCSADNGTYSVFEGGTLIFQVPDHFALRMAMCIDTKNSRNDLKVKPDWRAKRFSISDVRLAMNTTLNCTIARYALQVDSNSTFYSNSSKYTAFNCPVTISVLKGNMSVETNGMALGAQLVDPMTSHARYAYKYQDGEIVETTCMRLLDEGTTYMSYHDANGTALFSVNTLKSGDDSKNLIFRSLMQLDKNNSYLNCSYISQTSPTFVHQTYYRLQESGNHTISAEVFVNGLKLVNTPRKTTASTLAEFQYYYIDGEELNVECKVYDHSTMILTEKFKKRYYWFSIPMTCGREPNKVNIMFKSDLHLNFFYKVPRLSGLRANDILYQYTSGVNKWTVHYLYDYNETLNLTCVCRQEVGTKNNNASLQWKFRGIRIYNSINPIENEFNIMKNIRSFTLNDTDNLTEIVCMVTSNKPEDALSKVILKLHAKSPTVVHKRTEEREIEIQRKMPIKDDVTADDSGAGYHVWVIMGATVSTVVIVVGFCVPMACQYMKTRVQRRVEHQHYENMDEEDRPIPIFPSQWNEYAEVGPHYTEIDYGYMINNNDYQGHVQEQLSKETQNHYTEINVTLAGGGGISVSKNTPKGSVKYSNLADGETYAYADPACCSSQLANDKRYVNS